MSNLAEKRSINEFINDEDMENLTDTIFNINFKKYPIKDIRNITDEELDDVIGFLNDIPFTSAEINSFVRLGLYTKEELEKENKKLYETRQWEQYI